MRHRSTHWLEEELSQTSEQLERLLTLERAAAERHTVENTPETEAAYEGRREEADLLRDWQAQLVKELNRRAVGVSPKKHGRGGFGHGMTPRRERSVKGAPRNSGGESGV
jgi:hypothetical protein